MGNLILIIMNQFLYFLVVFIIITTGIIIIINWFLLLPALTSPVKFFTIVFQVNSLSTNFNTIYMEFDVHIFQIDFVDHSIFYFDLLLFYLVKKNNWIN